jgi:hypothetical protein
MFLSDDTPLHQLKIEIAALGPSLAAPFVQCYRIATVLLCCIFGHRMRRMDDYANDDIRECIRFGCSYWEG